MAASCHRHATPPACGIDGSYPLLLPLGRRDRIENQHSCDTVPVLFLFGRIHAMRSGIHSKTVHARLYWHVGQLPEVVRIVLLKHGDRTARTADVYAS